MTTIKGSLLFYNLLSTYVRATFVILLNVWLRDPSCMPPKRVLVHMQPAARSFSIGATSLGQKRLFHHRHHHHHHHQRLFAQQMQFKHRHDIAYDR